MKHLIEFKTFPICIFMFLFSSNLHAEKIEAESYIEAKSGSTKIVLENSNTTIGYFDEEGEQLIYEISVPETGMYRFTFTYVAQKDGHIRIQMDDNSYFVYDIAAYRELGDNWWQLPQKQWYDFPIEKGASFYLTEGTHVMTVINEGAVFNLDYFTMQKSNVKDKDIVQIKTTPSKIELMTNEYVDIYPKGYNQLGELIAAPTTWSDNASNGRYTSGNSYGSDMVTITMGDVTKNINVSIAKPTKKKEFVVSKYGQLQANGSVKSQNGETVSLMGPSFYWSCSAPLWWNKETVDYLVSKYNVQIIRLPIAIAPCGSNGQTSCQNPPDTWNKDCYYYRPDYTRKMVDEVVKAAIENDIYVIIDFHEHVAQDWTNLAKEFFTYFAKKWGDYPNVMYEIYNEPVCDNNTVVNYAKEVIPTIRAIDKDNIIIVGSASYSREPDGVTSAGSGYSNIAYTWHGYVEWGHQSDWNSHSSWNTSIPVVVTEWGVNWSKNDGGLLNIYRQKGVINCFWSMSNLGGDDSKWSILKSDCYKISDWSDSDMNENGAYLLQQTKSWVNFTPTILDDHQDLKMTICEQQVINLPQNSVSLSGGATGGTEKYSYEWKQVSGPNEASIDSKSSAKTTVSNMVAGDYVFSLSVSDGEDELSETVVVKVRPEGFVDPCLIDDVADNDIVSLWGGRWDVYDDADKKANPHSSITSAEKLPNNQSIKAEIKLGNQWSGDGWMSDPYCGVELYMNKREDAADLSECSEITYRFRGDSHEFRVEMQAVKDEDYHSCKVSSSKDWTTVKISWNALSQASDWGVDMALDKSDIRKFSWQVKGSANTSATLEIDDVSCVGLTTNAKKVLKNNQFYLYPNPISNGEGVIYVNEVCEVRVINSLGGLEMEFVAVPNMPNRISIGKKGLYLIKSNRFSEKLIVR